MVEKLSTNQVVVETKTKMLEYSVDMNYGIGGDPWFQGYISALASYGLISESQFDELLKLCGTDASVISEIINTIIVKQWDNSIMNNRIESLLAYIYDRGHELVGSRELTSFVSSELLWMRGFLQCALETKSISEMDHERYSNDLLIYIRDILSETIKGSWKNAK